MTKSSLELLQEYRNIIKDNSISESEEPKRIKHVGVDCSSCKGYPKKAARWRLPNGYLICDSCKRAQDTLKKEHPLNGPVRLTPKW